MLFFLLLEKMICNIYSGRWVWSWNVWTFFLYKKIILNGLFFIYKKDRNIWIIHDSHFSATALPCMGYENPQLQHPSTFQINAPHKPTSCSPASFIHKLKTDMVFRSKWAELDGAMWDLGTYIPIVLALTLANDLNLGTTLIFTGIYNIVTGSIYGVSMPVQPRKAIAVVAISGSEFGVPEIMAAGILTGGFYLYRVWRGWCS